ncbi:MAG: hypothetical protein ACYDDV_12295 [Methanoregula sp.]
MNGLHGLLLLLFCMLLVMSSGCTSPAIDEARYKNEGISVRVTSSRDVAGASMQVTIYQIRDLQQTEYATVNTPVILKTGNNEINLPAPLEPGSYKLYIYLIQNGERKLAVIRDIVV